MIFLKMSMQGTGSPSRMVEILNTMNSQYPDCWTIADTTGNKHYVILNDNLTIDVEEAPRPGVFAKVSVFHWLLEEETPFKVTSEIPGPNSLGVLLYECIGPPPFDTTYVNLYSNGMLITDGYLVENEFNGEQKNFVCEVDEPTLVELFHIFANTIC